MLQMGDLNYTMHGGPAVWQFEDGWVECGDLVIGADGGGSRVRQQLLPDVTAHYAGYVAWRGLVGEADVPEEAAAILCERFTFYEFPNSHVLSYLVPREHEARQGWRDPQPCGRDANSNVPGSAPRPRARRTAARSRSPG